MRIRFAVWESDDSEVWIALLLNAVVVNGSEDVLSMSDNPAVDIRRCSSFMLSGQMRSCYKTTMRMRRGRHTKLHRDEQTSRSLLHDSSQWSRIIDSMSKRRAERRCQEAEDEEIGCFMRCNCTKCGENYASSYWRAKSINSLKTNHYLIIFYTFKATKNCSSLWAPCSRSQCRPFRHATH